MSRRCLRLSLRAGESLPTDLPWRLERGYVWLSRVAPGGEFHTLGVWGPGELVIPGLTGLCGLELRSLSPVVVVEEELTGSSEREFLQEHLHQTAILLLLSRVRPAEVRLLQLLDWFGVRFGTMTSEGVILRFGDRPLTHQQLADIAGITRVTVTKALSHYREAGRLAPRAGGALLLRGGSADLWDLG